MFVKIVYLGSIVLVGDCLSVVSILVGYVFFV